MFQDEYTIAEALGIINWPADKREAAIMEATMRIGEAVLRDINDEKYAEYSAIVDDNHAVIDKWLADNVPDYKNNPLYQAMESTVSEDPEHNNPAKLFATMAWFKVNVPDAEARTQKVLADYKQELFAST